MTTARLYLFLLCGVLCLSGCGGDRSNSGTPGTDAAAAAPRDTASPTARAPDTTGADGLRPNQGEEVTSGLRVLVLGNSIAAGRGVSSEQAFPAHLQQKVDSLGWDVTVQNAGVSGATTAGGLQRIGWLLGEEVDVLVLELGGNDGLRGIDPATTQENLAGIVDTTLAAYPDARVLLTAMRLPTNLGPDYTERFRAVYPAVAEQYERVQLVEFDRRLQAGADSLMQADGIHPTAAGHRLVARDVWRELRPLLEQMRRADPA